VNGSARFVGLVISIIGGFYLFDAMIDTWIFSDKTFKMQLLQPSNHEIYIRSIVSLAILIAAIIWRYKSLQHRRLDNEIIAGEALYRNLVDNCPDSIIVHRQNHMLYLNDVALSYLGAPDTASLSGHVLDDFVHPTDRPLAQKRRAAMESGTVMQPATMRLLLPDQQVRHAIINSSLIMFEGQKAVLTFCHDVTQEVETRKNLTASQERLSLALEAAQDGLWDWDMANDKLVYNSAWAKMVGIEDQHLVHTPATWADLVHPDDKTQALAASAAHARGESPVYESEVRLRHAAGHYIWVLDRGKVVEFAPDGTPLRMTGTHRNINARKEAEIALEIRNNIAETFLTSAREDVFLNILPHIGKAVESSVALLGILDLHDNIHIASYDGSDSQRPTTNHFHTTRHNLPKTFSRILTERSAEIINDELMVSLLTRPVRRAVTVPIISQDKVLGFLVVADRAQDYAPKDIAVLGSLAGYLAPVLEFQMESEEKEGQLRQAQKMEAIGALAGGIAHDFNNILQAILGFSTLALEEAQGRKLPYDDFITDDLERVIRATERGRELVNRILLFSRRQEQEQQLVDLSEIIKDAVGLLTNTIPATIEVHTSLATDCGSVLADPAQISQVIMNLATNSFHAMEQDGGILTFTVRPITAHGNDPLVPDSLINHDLICMTVSDTGPGMDPQTLERVYDPFFTTKEVGKGTGLGLSVVHGIVAEHNGEIVLESSLGQGTSAHVFLPVLVESLARPRMVETPAIEASTKSKAIAGFRILFLDDEADITALGKALLEKQGHHVLALNNSHTALEYLRQAPNDIDLLITDLTMPQIGRAHV